MLHLVAVYRQDRAFGGGEEGGWFYDTGTLVRVIACTHNEECAYTLARRANALLERRNRAAGLHEPSSVLSGGDWLGAEVHEGNAPATYPATRPYYE